MGVRVAGVHERDFAQSSASIFAEHTAAAVDNSSATTQDNEVPATTQRAPIEEPVASVIGSRTLTGSNITSRDASSIATLGPEDMASELATMRHHSNSTLEESRGPLHYEDEWRGWLPVPSVPGGNTMNYT